MAFGTVKTYRGNALSHAMSVSLLALLLAGCMSGGGNVPAPIASVAEMDTDKATAAINIESLSAVIAKIRVMPRPIIRAARRLPALANLLRPKRISQKPSN